ncbi:tetratricopeptide repeat-containing sensor histidine kinase [Marivirga salinae]|uniref:histidine kinase n=1 Tax=Marivirga salinarum TaxID=3059078 RepID=A0AA49GC56_9BACT|nr:tetratricopeptide repeat-containing sensor histidine kinase [Marivirga sp. BDSF4-3]WKK75074.2 tetratricopeptide repeat-containing sensor histidine kinase [Marivirga sp. BDSF4-3]
MKAIKILFFLLLSYSSISAQGSTKDKNELLLLKHYENEDFNKVVKIADSLLQLENLPKRARIYQIKADALYFLNDVNASLESYLLAIEHLAEAEIDTVYLIENYSHAGFCYLYLGQYVEALPYYEKALKISRSANDSTEISTQLSHLGNIHTHLNNFELAEEYFQRSYEINFKLQDSVALAYDLVDLGSLFFRMGEFKKAVIYYKNGLKVEKTRADNHNTLILRLGKLADAYMETGAIDSAVFFIEKATRQAISINDSLSLHKNWLVKGKILLKQERFDSARELGYRLQQYFESETINQYDVEALMIVAKANYLMGNTNDAIRHLTEVIGRLKTKDHKAALSEIYQLRSEIFETIGQNKKAIEDLRLYLSYTDSLNLEKRQNTILSLSKIYDTRSKEQKIELLENKTALQKVQAENERRFRLILILAVSFLLALAILFYVRYREKQKNATLLTDKNTALRELNTTKDKLFAIISHDLRNPVSAFRNMTEALVENQSHLDKAKISHYLKKMQTNAAEVETQLNDLLAWASKEIGKERLELQDLAVEPMIEQVFRLLSPLAENKSIRLEYKLEDDFVIHTHPELFKTVIRNLINNAIKFTEEGGEVNLYATRKNGAIIFTIHDNGIGIGKEQQGILFSDEKMKANENSGMGMGLSLTKDIMDRLKGEILVESKENVGTTFTLKFVA